MTIFCQPYIFISVVVTGMVGQLRSRRFIWNGSSGALLELIVGPVASTKSLIVELFLHVLLGPNFLSQPPPLFRIFHNSIRRVQRPQWFPEPCIGSLNMPEWYRNLLSGKWSFGVCSMYFRFQICWHTVRSPDKNYTNCNFTAAAEHVCAHITQNCPINYTQIKKRWNSYIMCI